jgi:hypothetical protein
MSTAALDPLVIEKGWRLRTFFEANPSKKDRFHNYLFLLLSLFEPFQSSHGPTNLRSGGDLQLLYPTEWVVDLPLLRKEVAHLLIQTKSLRESESTEMGTPASRHRVHGR